MWRHARRLLFQPRRGANRLAVKTARVLYHLPYFYADMRSDDTGTEIVYRSKRKQSEAEFEGRYRPRGEVNRRSSGTVEHWLTERYCLYTTVNDSVYWGEIHHEPWPLQDAEADIRVNTMARAAGISLPDTQPLLHFARELDVLIWPLRRI